MRRKGAIVFKSVVLALGAVLALGGAVKSVLAAEREADV
jgi:hypothetical protein